MKPSVEITIEDAHNVAADIADLLCWWQGFMAGRKMAGDQSEYVAQNGIERLTDLNIKIKQQLKK